MRLLKLLIIGIFGGLILTVGYVRSGDAVDYVNNKVAGVLTAADAVAIYETLRKDSGQGDVLPPLTVDNSGEVNAFTTPEGITVFRGLLEKVDKDELALVLGHEISHFLLGHVFLPYYANKDQVRVEEMQADKYGAFLMMRSGYDICKGRDLFKLFITLFGDNQDQDHPDFAFRYAQLNVNCGE